MNKSITKFEYRRKGTLWLPDVEYFYWNILYENDFYTYIELQNWEKMKLYHENLIYIKTCKE